VTRIHDMGGRFGDGPIPIKKTDGKVVDDDDVHRDYVLHFFYQT